MTTKFERIFRLARRIMLEEGILAKEAILKAIKIDEEEKPKTKPNKEYFRLVRAMKNKRQKRRI